MPTDIRFSLPNTPGAFARAARLLSDAGINIEGLGSDIRPGEPWGYLHVLVDDFDKAADVLERNGHEILDLHEIDVIEAEDRPGVIAEICESYAERGENIEVLYLCTRTRVAVGTEGMRRDLVGMRAEEASYSDKRRL